MKVFSCLFAVFSLFGQIQEMAHFSEAQKHITDDTILLLDIDDTLISPVQMLGGDTWFEYRMKQHQKELSFEQSLERTLAEWESLRHLTKMELVEEEIPEIVASLQARGIEMLGLTHQGLALATRTKIQLADHQIHLVKTAPLVQDYCFSVEGHAVLYRQGILFTSGKPKHVAFLQLCDALAISPKHVVAIDDKQHNLLGLEKALEERGISFVGLRYNRTDARKKAFVPEIADCQWARSTFDHLLSDEEARQLLQKF